MQRGLDRGDREVTALSFAPTRSPLSGVPLAGCARRDDTTAPRRDRQEVLAERDAASWHDVDRSGARISPVLGRVPHVSGPRHRSGQAVLPPCVDRVPCVRQTPH